MDNGYRIPDSVTANKYGDDILTKKFLNSLIVTKTKRFLSTIICLWCMSHFCPTPDDSAFASWNPDDDASDTSFFRSMVNYMDKKIGKFLKKLRTAGLDQNTLVFFAGDNGTSGDIYYNAHGALIKAGNHFPKKQALMCHFFAYCREPYRKEAIVRNLIDFTDFFQQLPGWRGENFRTSMGYWMEPVFIPNLPRQVGKGKTTIVFFITDPHPGYDSLRRWVVDKSYKLTIPRILVSQASFYHIKKDPEELSPFK
jgi:hypothetical protein